jgi:hypothetical protein
MSAGVVRPRLEKRGLGSMGRPPKPVGRVEVRRRETGMEEGMEGEEARIMRFLGWRVSRILWAMWGVAGRGGCCLMETVYRLWSG